MPSILDVDAKKFRLRRAQRKHIVVSLPEVYTHFLDCFLVFCPSFFGALRTDFLPPIFRDPGGQIFFLPPIFRDPGGQMKKVVAPQMVQKKHPPKKKAGPGACFRIMDFSEFRDSGHQKSQIPQIKKVRQQ